MNLTTLNAIGNTPVVSLGQLRPDGAANVVVKLEYLNPTGSYKDRMALAIIEGAESRGELKPGMTVVEYTGGSTGSSLAFICSMKGYPFIAVSSDAFAQEKLRTMEALGATVEVIPSHGGGINTDLIHRMRSRALEIRDEHGAYFTNQFENRDAISGYTKIGEELIKQLDQPIAAFCGAVGTGGMLMGVRRALKSQSESTRIVALEPASSAVLTSGQAGSHTIEGIAIGKIPPMLADRRYDEARALDESEAREMARTMARKEGIFAGTSSGLNVLAATRLATEFGEDEMVVTVACDSALKYLNGTLYRN